MSLRAVRRAGVLFAVGLHAAAGAALLAYEPTRSALLAATPIMVEFLTPPAVETKPLPTPKVRPQPKPVAKPIPQPPEPAPRVLATVTEAPAAVLAPPPPPPPEVRPEPAPAPVAAVVAPIFNADYLENPAPEYPALSRRTREQGRVVLRVLVNAGGSADDVQVRDSSGFARLDATARDTVRGWRFVPARRGAEPVPAWVLIPIAFKLER